MVNSGVHHYRDLSYFIENQSEEKIWSFPQVGTTKWIKMDGL